MEFPGGSAGKGSSVVTAVALVTAVAHIRPGTSALELPHAAGMTNIYVFVCMYVSVCICICIDIYGHIYIYTHMCMYVYIYIYREREGGRKMMLTLRNIISR